MTDYLYKTPPFDHQRDIFNKSRDKEYFALLMEQGTGKSKVIIDTVAWLYSYGNISAMLVVAPSGVNRNWIINEIPAHMPDYVNCKAAWYSSQPSKKEENDLWKVLSADSTDCGLRVVAMNIEALATAKGVSFLKNFLINFHTLLVVDESSVIKNPKAIRTKNLLKLSVHAKYRRILTGTPITQGPLDLYTQFSFLDSHILRTSSYYAFRNRYAILKEMRTAGRSFMNVVGYTNIDELTKLIEPHSYRVTKDQCLDLPEKLYAKRYVELSDSQKKLYNALKKEVVAEFNGMTMSAPLALTKLLRLQQIVGGFFQPDINIDNPLVDIWQDEEAQFPNFCAGESPPTGKTQPQPIDKVNTRVESLIELLGETNGKVIIWARFRAEIANIVERIRGEHGQTSVVEYHGGIASDDRSKAIESFQNIETTKYFVGHVQAGGKGITLTSANTVIYFSNDFSLENRLQSEDRAHRIGQRNNVTYIDFIATGTLDEKIVSTLRDKKNIADLITGDAKMEEWI